MNEPSLISLLTNDLRFAHGRGARSYLHSDGLILLTEKSIHIFIDDISAVNKFEKELKDGKTLTELQLKYKHRLSSVDFEDIREVRDASSYTEQGIVKIYSKKKDKPVTAFAYSHDYFRGYIPLWFSKNGLNFPTVIEKQSGLQKAFPLILGAISLGFLIYLFTM